MRVKHDHDDACNNEIFHQLCHNIVRCFTFFSTSDPLQLSVHD